MPQKSAWLLFGSAVFLISLSMSFSRNVRAADCTACVGLLAKRNAASQDEKSYASLLISNQNALAALPHSDISKRVKISSNILILTARIEKSGNDKILIDQEYNAKGCQTCPR